MGFVGKLAMTAQIDQMRLEFRQGATEGVQKDPQEIAPGIRVWSVLPDGDLRVELNLRRSEGPTPTVRQLLAALGVAEEEIPRVRVVREAVLLRSRAGREATPAEAG